MVKNSVDPITLEVVQNALSSIADELALVIMRAAYSNIVRDSMDYSTAVCDFSGKTIAQGLTNPVHLGSFPHAMKNLVFQQKANMNEGDIFIFNDPYGSGGMHLPDFYIIKPIFINDSIEGYTATLAHQTDVGGIAPGGMGVFSKEIYQEGLRLPILKLYERNKPNKAILDIIQKNTRMPSSVLGDIKSQIAACYTGEKAFVELFEMYGRKKFRLICKEIHNYAESIIRRNISKLPNGIFKFQDYLDGLGENPKPIKFAVTLKIKKDRIIVDWTGTSPQVKAAINGPLPTTHAMSYLGVRCALAAKMPNCEGYMRAISVIAPKGSIVNPNEPAACGARGIICFRMFDTILGAFSKILPDRIPAANEGGSSAPHISGRDKNNKPFLASGGLMGCWGGSLYSDGFEGISNPAANLSNTPVEVLESQQPVQITKYAFVKNSGGPGKNRGGMALVRGYRLLEKEAELVMRSDRRSITPYGLKGGFPGTPSWNIIRSGKKQTLLPACPMSSIKMVQNDEFIHIQAGGGGFGDPLQRDPNKVLNDFLNGLIDLDYAEQVYGVIISKNKIISNKTVSKRKILKKDKKNKSAHFKLFHNYIGISYETWNKSYRNSK